jgi:hypothetical protein
MVSMMMRAVRMIWTNYMPLTANDWEALGSGLM